MMRCPTCLGRRFRVVEVTTRTIRVLCDNDGHMDARVYDVLPGESERWEQVHCETCKIDVGMEQAEACYHQHFGEG